MANVEKTVSIIFSGVDKTGTAISGVSRKIDGFAGGVQNAAKPLADLGDGILAIDAALAALVAGGLALSINEFGKFNDQFREISTLFDANPIDLETFEQDVLNYSKASTKSLADIEGAIYSAISAGIDYSDSLEFMTSAEQLSVAGKGDLQATTVLLASTLNAYGASVDEAGRYSDTFFKTVQLGQTTLPELAQTLANVTGVAAAGDVEIETLSAAIAALTAAGLPTSQAMTGVKGVLTALIKPSSEATKKAQELGIQFDVQALKAQGLDGILRTVREATGGNVEEMGKLFGRVEGLNSAVILANDSSGKFANSLEEMKSKAGATAEAYDKMVDGYEASNTKFMNNVRFSLIEIGGLFEDHYSDIVGNAGEIASSLSSFITSETFQPVREDLDGMLDWLTDFLGEVAQNLPEAFEDVDWSDLLDSIHDLGGEVEEALEALFGEVDLSTPEGLRVAIQTVIDGVEALINVTSGMVDSWRPFLEMIGKVAEEFLELDDESQKAAGNVFGFAQGIEKFMGVVKGFAGGLDLVGKALIVIAGTGAANTVLNFGKMAAGAAGNTSLLSSGLTKTIGSTAAKTGLLGLAFASGYAAGELVNKYIPQVGNAVGKVIEWSDKLLDWTGTQEAQKNLLEDTTVSMEEYAKKINEVPEEKTTEIKELGYDEVLAMVQAARVDINEIPEEKKTEIKAEVDTNQVKTAARVITETLPNGHIVITEVKADQAALSKTQKALDEAIPADKLMRIEADIDIAHIKAQSEIIQKSIEWEAKVDIAQVQAAAKMTEAAFESVNVAIESTENVLGGLFEGYLGTEDAFKETHIEAWIRDEQARRNKALEQQGKLIDAQAEYLKQQARAISRGESTINISADGLAPHLQAVLRELLEYLQVHVSQDINNFLVGVPS